jgi:hypothetical protein
MEDRGIRPLVELVEPMVLPVQLERPGPNLIPLMVPAAVAEVVTM